MTYRAHGGGGHHYYPPIPGMTVQGQRAMWVFNGEILTITEFAQRVYGDTPQRTEFLLKYHNDHIQK